MGRSGRVAFLMGVVLEMILRVSAQIDPTARELIQMGYTQPFEGRGPLAAYGYYYRNKPDWLDHTNLTLRLVVAPVYLDSELGFKGLLGPGTDVGVGVAGGGFADSYSEVRHGKYHRDESFLGHGGELSASVYHLLNPTARIPLCAMLRGSAHGSVFTDDEKTADDFELPDDQFSFRVRTGLRWGGREPVLTPELAMEVSVWYEGFFRLQPGRYGYNGDRELQSRSHWVWGRALLDYTLPELKHGFGVAVTGGTGFDLDRLSAHRLGGDLPLCSEFPLMLPGYYFEELSAESFVLFGGNYHLPLDSRQCWQVGASAATAWTDYLAGFELSNRWNTGVGGGLLYRSPTGSWQLALQYGYAFNAVRDHSRGAQSLTFLLQFDLGRTRERFFAPNIDLNRARGLQSILKTIFQ
ncbi:MAG TPA: hypothetical protein PKM73_02435 [Verrucomicrobiota bacterium]|nr:hypothetical protein [Verrucomicrobiota bacterium]HNU49772.1 hypothetical protein [Verrucomicrobiota bacterium]